MKSEDHLTSLADPDFNSPLWHDRWPPGANKRLAHRPHKDIDSDDEEEPESPTSAREECDRLPVERKKVEERCLGSWGTMCRYGRYCYDIPDMIASISASLDEIFIC
jgi:hypothetical protein